MQINNVYKLAVAALLSVTMAACSSTQETDSVASATAPGSANPSAGNTGGGLTAEQQREAELRATTTFYFEFDKSDLNAQARDALVVHAKDLKANPSRRIRLEGHGDERGTREYNLALGERRSQAVERYLQ